MSMVRISLLLITLILATDSRAQDPQSQIFSYQGRLLENGAPANGNFDLRFTLHDDATLSSPSPPLVELSAWPVVDGLLIVDLDFPGQFQGRQRWLQMEVDGELILPRQPVLAAPVAQFALDTELRGEVSGLGSATQVTGARTQAEPGTLVRRDASGAIDASVVRAQLQGHADSAAVFTQPLAGEVSGTQGATTIAAGAVTGAKIANSQVVRSINGWRDDVSMVGQGTVTVSNTAQGMSITGTGIAGISAGNGLTGGGNSGTVPLAVDFGGLGSQNVAARADHTHYGQTWNGSGVGLRVVNTSSSGSTLLGTSSSLTNFDGSTIAGIVLNAESESLGVYGATISTNQNSAGVWGQASGAGGAKGVWGHASGPGTTAVFASASSGAQAGRFQGNVDVTGQLSKAGGSFRIDHPLDPENKYLYHSFVESPDMKNIYDGLVQLDDKGTATIHMEDWFEALNRDFRYQLTAIGAAMPNLHVSEPMRDGQFAVAGGVPGAQVSWMVTGIRQDAWAEANRIPVEEDKPANERGSFLHPEAHGLPATRALHPPVADRATRLE